MSEQPAYETSTLGFYLRVYKNRIEFKDGKGKHSVSLSQIVNVSLPFFSGRSFDIETTGGQKYSITAKNKKEAINAINEQLNAFRQQDRPSGSVADELVKLAELRDAGVLTMREFEDRKKSLLSS